MPEWEIKPWEQFPQTPEIYLIQLEQELISLESKRAYLEAEKRRVQEEMFGEEIPGAGN